MEENSSPDRKTHCGRILARLIEARGGEVPAHELADVSGLQFQTRIYELRHELGFDIKNRTERTEGSQVHSFYRLVTRPVSGATKTAEQKLSPSLDEAGSLFGDLAPDRTCQE